MFRPFVWLLPLLAAGAAHAQDLQRVVSPDGKVEFRLFTIMPEGHGLNSLAYQVWWRGKPLLDTSCLGVNIHFDEPILGENVGLSSTKPLHGEGYSGLFADYLQNSSTGRRIDLEVRVYNDGVAFRYVIPQQTPLLQLLIDEDETEFHFAYSAPRPERSALPYIEEAPGVGWVGIFESRVADFPPMSLVRNEPNSLTAHLPGRPGDAEIAYVGATPWTGPWRIVAIGASRERLALADVVRGLTR
jgi:hypothetical protein